MTNLNEEFELPDDMWKEIFIWLNVKELCKIGLVSKKFNEYSNDPYFWKRFIEDEGNSLSLVEKNFTDNLSKNDKNYWKNLYIKSTEFEWIPEKYASITPDKKEFWNKGISSDKIEDDDIVYAVATSKQSWSSGKHTFGVRIVMAKQYGLHCTNTCVGFCPVLDTKKREYISANGYGTIKEISGYRDKGPPFQIGDLIKITIDFNPEKPIITFENENPNFETKFGQVTLSKKESLKLYARVIRGGDRIRLESITHHG